MAEVSSIIGGFFAGSRSGVREHVRPGRVAAGAGVAEEPEQSPAIRRATPAGLRSRLLRVHAAARKLVSGETTSVFRTPGAPVATSSRSAAVLAEGVEGMSRGQRATLEVRVTDLARAQVNQGAVLGAGAQNEMQPGVNTFSVRIGSGAAATLSFTNDSTDTNEQALAKLADVISAHAGLRADVVRDLAAGTVRLDVTATETGTSHGFTITDTAGDVVATLGLGTTTQSATNAHFVVDGVPQASSTNTVFVDGGNVRLTLRDVTGPDADAAGATIVVDPDPVSTAVADLVFAVNDLHAFLAADGSLSALRTLGILQDILVPNAPALEGIGVAVGEGGRLAVDAERLDERFAAGRDAVEGLLGPPEGIATELVLAAESALGDVLGYAVNETLRDSSGFAGRPFIASGEGVGRGLLVDVVG
jgi:flagellar capping protein FliD